MGTIIALATVVSFIRIVSIAAMSCIADYRVVRGSSR